MEVPECVTGESEPAVFFRSPGPVAGLHLFVALEGPAEAKKLLDGLEWPADVTERVCYLVGHHHTYHDMDGMDYQILVEADFLVNLFEDKVSPDGCRNAYHKIFRTESGKRLYRIMYPTA